MEHIKTYLRDHPIWGSILAAVSWFWHEVAAFLPDVMSFVVNLGALAGAITAILVLWMTVAKWWREIGDPLLFRTKKRLSSICSRWKPGTPE